MREPVRAKVTTADRAEVEAEPEERALGVADARSDAQSRTRAAGTGKPYFYGAGRILGRVSRLYGYSLLLSGISTLFQLGFSSLPLTKWEDKDKGGVPRAHNELVSVLLMLWFAAGVSCLSRAGRGGPSCSWLATIVEGRTEKLTTSKNLSPPPQLDSGHSVARSTSRHRTRSSTPTNRTTASGTRGRGPLLAT